MFPDGAKVMFWLQQRCFLGLSAIPDGNSGPVRHSVCRYDNILIYTDGLNTQERPVALRTPWQGLGAPAPAP
jgi:hypothetical protein